MWHVCCVHNRVTFALILNSSSRIRGRSSLWLVSELIDKLNFFGVTDVQP